MDREKAMRAVKELSEAIGEDTEREGLYKVSGDFPEGKIAEALAVIR